jgi:2'-5' RNA ligase
MAADGAEHVGPTRVAGEAPLTDERIRAFFGIPLPDDNRKRLASYLRACAKVAPDFRWGVPDNLHLTVRFVGSIERGVAEGIAARISGAAFDVALGEVGTFKRGRLARVVWLGVTDGAAELTALAARVEAECQAAGLEPEARAFKAHLTLARARPRDGATLPALPPLPVLDAWHADEVVLYSSHLGRGGAVHEPIRVVRLAD